MCVLKYIVIFLIIFESTWCETKIGVPCYADGITGTCRSVSQCPYAIKRINEDQVKIPMCGYDEEGNRIVCCPIQNLQLKPGVFRNHFMASNDGVIKSNNMTCRYEGHQPLLYCENIPYVPDPPEPKGCPQLPSPKLNTKNVEHFLWNKCVDYQRYFNKCVEDEGKTNKFIRRDTCGIPASNRSVLRLLGGEPAQPRQFPHMVVIGCHNTFPTDDVDIVWVGQGSLISEKFILTAAHNLVSTEYGEVRYALMGSLNKKYTKELLLNIVRLIPHKLYSKTEKIHDIALLELHERVRFNEFIRPICLPVPDRKIETELTIAGWGDADVSGKASEVLLTTTVRENPSLFQRRYGDEHFMPETMICAGGSIGLSHRDSCMGDSGGPLMAQFTNLHCSYSIEGIVSYGSQCVRDIGVYTRVSYYLDWIIENVWPEEWEKIEANKNK